VDQGARIGEAAVQTLATEDAQFDLGPVQPTAVLGGVMNLQSLYQAASLYEAFEPAVARYLER